MTPSDSPSPTPDERLRAVLAECLDRLDTEGDAAVEDLCRRHPDLADALRRRLGRLRDSGLLAVEDGDVDPPEQVGDFRLVRRLGAGGMGVVYLAEQLSVPRSVVLKFVRPEYGFLGSARRRFQKEIEATGRLHHPGIVAIHAVGSAAGARYFAMEYVEGCPLNRLIAYLRTRGGRLPSGPALRDAVANLAGSSATDGNAGATAVFGGSWPEVCLRIVRQAAEALEHAHQRGVLHRDVKPSNIMLTPAGRVVLLDFGLASAEGTTRLTITGSPLGSLEYMAPEQLAGGQADVRTDVYGLGVTLYELLTLRSPFDDASEDRVREKVRSGTCPPIRRAAGNVPRDAGVLCRTAFAPEPERRYPSAGALARDIDNFLGLRPIDARPPSLGYRTRRWIRRRPATAATAGLGALLVLGIPTGYAVLEHRAGLRLESERQRTADTLRRTLTAIDRLGTQVANVHLADVPRAGAVQRLILAETARLYEDVLADHPGDADVRAECGVAHVRLGTFERKAGKSAAARREYERAAELLGEIHDRGEGPADATHHLVAVHNGLGILALQRRELEAAEERFGRALGLDGGIRPRTVEVEASRASALNNLASVHQRAGRRDARDRALDEAVAVLTGVLDESHDTGHHLRLASTWYSKGAFAHMEGAMDEAGEGYERALAILETRRRVDPEDPELGMRLGEVVNALAFLHMALGETGTARQHARRAVEVREALVADRPHRADLRSQLAGSLQVLVELRLARLTRGSAEGLLADCRRAITLQQQARDADPDNVRYRECLQQHYRLLLDLTARQGDPGALARAGDEMADRLPGVPAAVVAAAGAHHRAARLVPGGDPEHDPRAESHRERAVELLAAAVDAGYRDVDVLRGEAFPDLQGRTDFEEVLQGLRDAPGRTGRR